jgi:hypothetical protein
LRNCNDVYNSGTSYDYNDCSGYDSSPNDDSCAFADYHNYRTGYDSGTVTDDHNYATNHGYEGKRGWGFAEELPSYNGAERLATSCFYPGRYRIRRGRLRR